ncbi:hypothetical protein [Streptomyces winkii]|uniref:hypothetical protein n=1 Tax=Streptomyces winkii TaxID=3051178 RepID=UPI0028D2145F|nr:hypothetical protein [Streptomyces sp. DSM 40971]
MISVDHEDSRAHRVGTIVRIRFAMGCLIGAAMSADASVQASGADRAAVGQGQGSPDRRRVARRP